LAVQQVLAVLAFLALLWTSLAPTHGVRAGVVVGAGVGAAVVVGAGVGAAVVLGAGVGAAVVASIASYRTWINHENV
jgi:hypothetical protein